VLEAKTKAKNMAWVLFIVCLVGLFAQTPTTQGDHETNLPVQTTYAFGNQARTLEQSAPPVVASASVDDSRINPSQSITFTGILLYQGSTTPPGAGNSALSFDGVDDYVSVPISESLRPLSALTLVAWVKGNVWAAADYNDAISKASSWHMRIRDGNPRFWLKTDGVPYGWSDLRSPDFIPSGIFFHLAYTYDGTRMRLYVDGILKAEESKTGNIIYDDVNWPYVQISGYAPERALFNGTIDEVRIYNRALSGQEISEHYQGIYSNETGLVLHLGFDGNIQDSSGQGNHATFYRATWTDGYVNININIELGGTLKKTVRLVNSTNGGFTIPSVITESNVGIYNYTIYAIDATGQKTVQNQTVPVIVDKLKIVFKGTTDGRVDLGSSAHVYFNLTREYDNALFDETKGSVYINGTLATWDSASKYWKLGVTQSSITAKNYMVSKITDTEFGISTLNDKVGAQQIIWDRINVTLSVMDNRIDVGSSIDYSWTGVYEYDNSSFNGTIALNNTQTVYDTVGLRGYRVTSITDPAYGLTLFTTNELYCIWDTIKIVEGGVTRSSAYLGEAVTIWFKALYEFDNVKFDETKGTLYLNGSPMKWSTSKDRWEYNYTTDTSGPKTFKVSGVLDTQWGLTGINDVVGTQTITWKPKPFFETPTGIATLGSVVAAGTTLILLFLKRKRRS